jgi:hypothetical protein
VTRLALAFVLGVFCAAALPAAADSGLAGLAQSAERIARALERANNLTERGCR